MDNLIYNFFNHAEKHFVPEGRSALLRRLAEQSIYERVMPETKDVA